MANAKVFNINLVDFNIKNINSSKNGTLSGTEWAVISENEPDTVKLEEFTVEGIAPDGFGITPQSETEIIEGLTGEQGFSVDPTNGAEITLTLKSTSPSLSKMIAMYRDQQNGYLAPFAVEIDVKTEEIANSTYAEEGFGFSKMEVKNVMLVNFAPFETDESAAPDYEFEMVGYDWNIEHSDLDTV